MLPNRTRRVNLLSGALGGGQAMPRSTAQWTGFAVTLIVVLGRDLDIVTALPLGLAAALLCGLLADLRWRPALRRILGR